MKTGILAAVWVAILCNAADGQTGSVAAPAAAPLAVIDNFRVSPVNVEIISADPDSPQATTVPLTVTWTLRNGSPSRRWGLWVRASGTTVSGCPAIPVSAIKISCDKVTDPPQAGRGQCAATNASLSTWPVLLAQGKEDPHNNATYIVDLHLTFQDSWRYIATVGQSCFSDLTYILLAL